MLNRNFNIAFCILIFGFLYGCQDKTLHRDSRIAMGTFVEVISPDTRSTKIVFDEIKRIEDLLSKYNPDSEVSKLNKAGELTVSPDTLYIINKAKEFWTVSDGAFDITVGPLMDIWGFTDKNYRLPEESKIKEALSLVGSDKIIIDNKNNVVKLSIPGMKIDLGAIAKGYAVDCAIKKLRQAGVASCLINAGGQVYCLGTNFGKPWSVSIQNPRGEGSVGYLLLRDKAVATSGDYEQYFMIGHKRYSHIFNPKTGYPADSGVASVTVVADDSLTADALATSIFVLGKLKGQELAKKYPGVEIKIIESTNE